MESIEETFLTEQAIYRCERTKSFLCSLCNVPKYSSLEPSHLKSRQHVINLEHFDANFENHVYRVACKICNTKIDWADVMKHALSHKIAPWYKPKDMYKIFYHNHILKHDIRYYCYLCEIYFDDWSAAYVHLNLETHLELKNQISCDSTRCFTKKIYKSWICAGFVPGNGETINCKICDINFNENDADGHLRDPQHDEKKLRFVARLGEPASRDRAPAKADDSRKCQENSQKETKIENSKSKINSSHPQRAMICNFLLEPDVPASPANANCSSPQIIEEIPPDHSEDPWFTFNFPKINSKNSVCRKISPKFEKQEKKSDISDYLETPLNYVVVRSHALCSEALTGSNKKKRTIARQKNAEYAYYCVLCCCAIYSSETARDHLDGKRHAVRRKRYGCDDISMIKGDRYHCKRCHLRINDFTKLYHHLTSKEHKSRIVETSERDNESLSKDSKKNIKQDGAETLESEETTPFCEQITSSCELTTPSCDNTTPSCRVVSPSTRITSCIYVVKRNAKKSFCQICDNSQLPVATKKIDDHINGQRHTIALKRYGCDNVVSRENGDYHCSCCNLDIKDLANVYLHIKDKKHMSSLIKVKQDIPCNRKICDRTSALREIYQPPLENLLGDYIVQKITGDSSGAIANDIIQASHRAEDPDRSDRIVKRNTSYHPCNTMPGQRYRVEKHANRVDRCDERDGDVDGNTMLVDSLDTKQPELSTILTSMASDLSRLLKQVEENRKTRFADKARSGDPSRDERDKNRENQGKVWTEKIVCPICEFNVADLTTLHSHMAQHFSDEFLSTKKSKNRRNLIINDAPIADQNGISNAIDESENGLLNSVLPINGASSSCTNGINPIDESTITDIPNFHESSCQINDSSSNEPNEKDDDDDDNSSSRSVSSGPLLSKDSSPVKKSPRRKIDMKMIIQTLDFDKDFIYDMTDKLNEMKLGLKLCLVIDSQTIYCLVCRKTVSNTLQDYFDHLWSVDHCDYLETIEKDHLRFANCPEEFSDLDLAQEYMQEINDNHVRCLICAKDIVNDNSSLEEHIYDKYHELTCEKLRSNALTNYEDMKLRLKCDWYGVQKYWCVPCFAHMETEVSFVKHLEGRRHANNIRKSDNYGKTMILDYCRWCALLWCGYRTTYTYHTNISVHKWLVRDGYYAIDDLSIFAKNLLAEPDREADERIEYLDAISARERAKELKLLRDIEKIAKIKFPRAKAYTFGSRVTGLGAEDSDIDVFLDCRNMYDGKESSQARILYFITGVHQCLSKDPASWDVEELLTNCRSPIIRACHRATGLSCDISFENGLAVENTKLIRTFNCTYPSCRKLILVLKKWLEYCDLSGSGNITSYALYWLVIFYLQKETILPSIATLVSMKKKSRLIAGWETGVSHDFTYWEPEGALSIRELLKRFFKFYANFDFRFDVACPLLGETIKKRDFVDISGLPDHMRSYAYYMKYSEHPEPFRIDSAMCIQDPFDLQHNLTKAVSKVYLNRFRTCCSKSLDLLSSI